MLKVYDFAKRILVVILLYFAIPSLFIVALHYYGEWKYPGRLSPETAVSLIQENRNNLNIKNEVRLTILPGKLPATRFVPDTDTDALEIRTDKKYLNINIVRHEMFHACRIANRNITSKKNDSRLDMTTYLYLEEPLACLYALGIRIGC